ncbi:Pre-rRNA-processing protein ipi3, partial [Dinochytrium kinnereticum]
MDEIEELAAITYGEGSMIDLWDVKTGAIVASLKGNTSSPRCMQVSKSCHHNSVGLKKDFIFSSQHDKPIMHVWSWAKDHPVHKFILPEKLSAVAVSNSGRFCLGAGFSGRFYLWEVASGRMIGMCDSHFKAIRVARFSSDDKGFLTGGEDASLRVWSLASFFQTPENPEAHRVFSGHTLPITDAAFSIDVFHQSRAFSVSLDKTLR